MAEASGTGVRCPTLRSLAYCSVFNYSSASSFGFSEMAAFAGVQEPGTKLELCYTHVYGKKS